MTSKISKQERKGFRKGVRLWYHRDKWGEGEGRMAGEIRILYQDRRILLCLKPPGVVSVLFRRADSQRTL